ncbi:spexin prohormone 1 isoform X1 [Syngnathus scovelli]|uniref:spexin prohormone 1 isoform X1 n=1 Tax=Syngnathus scovelli TaxID=161590 RepID=UPI00210FB085|nr:spexin prohormone 1 isoform X1 [Syngnathus scovelli]
MKGLKTVTLIYIFTLLLVAFVTQSQSAPKGSFQRRNWTPQAMLYLKGTQGRRFISEDRKEGDVYDTLHLETRSQNTEKLSVDQAATILLNFLQQLLKTQRRCTFRRFQCGREKSVEESAPLPSLKDVVIHFCVEEKKRSFVYSISKSENCIFEMWCFNKQNLN